MSVHVEETWQQYAAPAVNLVIRRARPRAGGQDGSDFSAQHVHIRSRRQGGGLGVERTHVAKDCQPGQRMQQLSCVGSENFCGGIALGFPQLRQARLPAFLDDCEVSWQDHRKQVGFVIRRRPEELRGKANARVHEQLDDLGLAVSRDGNFIEPLLHQAAIGKQGEGALARGKRGLDHQGVHLPGRIERKVKPLATGSLAAALGFG